MNPRGTPENLIPLKKGQTANPNGRPRKMVTALKEIGYKRSEINDTIQSMLALTQAELKEVYDNPNATILERTIANALNKGLVKGHLFAIESLLTRAFGMPKIEVEASFKETPIFKTIDLTSIPEAQEISMPTNEGV